MSERTKGTRLPHSCRNLRRKGMKSGRVLTSRDVLRRLLSEHGRVILGATPGISDPLPVYDQNDYGRRCCRRVEDLGFASALQCRHPTRQPHYVVSRRCLS